jgi:farnesyl-diphosphate farnesyltransferase
MQQPKSAPAMSDAGQDGSSYEVKALLARSSRTFALTIPLLPSPLQHWVGVAYLFLRAADGVEDTTTVEASRRVRLLRLLGDALSGQESRSVLASEFRDFAELMPVGGERDVVASLELLFKELETIEKSARDVIVRHADRVCRRMAHAAAMPAAGASIALSDLGELQDYMYSVAGIVGELLTDLFCLHTSDADRYRLLARSADFGAALQLTNILKDAAEDALSGRFFLPPEVSYLSPERGAPALLGMIELAEIRLRTATSYILLVSAAYPGVRLFCLVPVLLALATLRALVVERSQLLEGKVVKIDRETVFQLVARAEQAVSSDRLIAALCDELHEELEEVKKEARGEAG